MAVHMQLPRHYPWPLINIRAPLRGSIQSLRGEADPLFFPSIEFKRASFRTSMRSMKLKLLNGNVFESDDSPVAVDGWRTGYVACLNCRQSKGMRCLRQCGCSLPSLSLPLSSPCASEEESVAEYERSEAKAILAVVVSSILIACTHKQIRWDGHIPHLVQPLILFENHPKPETRTESCDGMLFCIPHPYHLNRPHLRPVLVLSV